VHCAVNTLYLSTDEQLTEEKGMLLASLQKLPPASSFAQPAAGPAGAAASTSTPAPAPVAAGNHHRRVATLFAYLSLNRYVYPVELIYRCSVS